MFASFRLHRSSWKTSSDANVTKEDFLELAMSVTQPAIAYHDNHFDVHDSALQRVMNGAMAARVFYPRVLACSSKQTCLHLINEVFDNLANPDLMKTYEPE